MSEYLNRMSKEQDVQVMKGVNESLHAQRLREHKHHPD